MTKISNQYSLTNILTADLANSRLGINNVSPTVALDVTGAGRISSSLGVGAAAAYASTTLLVRSNSSTSTNWAFIAEDNATNQIFGIRNNGNVGIGTGSPTAIVHALKSNATAPTSGTTPSGYALSVGTENGNNGGLWFSADFGGDQGIAGIAGTRVSGYETDLRFYTNNTNSARAFTERMRITAEGNLGFGMTPYNNGLSKAIDLVGGGGMFGFSNNFYLSGNGYFTDSWRYKTTGSIAIIEMASSGIITFATSSSGSANAVKAIQELSAKVSLLENK
jgi:hypothetical protein